MMNHQQNNSSAAPLSEICLVVIYNHNYEKNIPKIERLYQEKFSEIFHLMPFYQGDNPRVIGVYDSSHQFNNYITQAYDRLASKPFTHYFFVADDMIIRQDLNENNVLDQLNLDKDSAYIPFLKIIDNETFFTWPWALKQVGKFHYPFKASEFRNFMPDIETARQRVEQHGLDWHQGYTSSVLPYAVRGGIDPFTLDLVRSYFRYLLLVVCFKINRGFLALLGRTLSWPAFIAKFAKLIARKQENPEYPLIWGYADIFLLPASRFKEFCHMSGLLASGRVMVEVAVPTAMALTIDRVVQDHDVGALDGREGSPEDIRERNNSSLASLIQNWRKDVLYYHPIKLSQWKFDI